jgi:hypothetical protein
MPRSFEEVVLPHLDAAFNYARHAGMSYWAVSDVNDTDLDQFVHALQQ